MCLVITADCHCTTHLESSQLGLTCCRCDSIMHHWTLNHFSTTQGRYILQQTLLVVDRPWIHTCWCCPPHTTRHIVEGCRLWHSWLSSAFRLTVTMTRYTKSKRWRKKEPTIVYC